MDSSTMANGSTMAIGKELHELVAALTPPLRSITGDGVRATLDTLREAVTGGGSVTGGGGAGGGGGGELEFVVHEVPSDTPVLDWTVPKEWNVREAWLAGPDGKRVVDVADNPLHLLGYSVPVRARMSLDELRPHLFSMPDRPSWVPYRTSYYNENWGFCLPHDTVAALPDGEYDVCIDTSLTDGSLTYGEVVVPGEVDTEFVVTTHTCHPATANDNGSGMAVAALLARELAQRERRRFTYRVLFIPGTIGSITWLARNPDVVPRIRHGLVLTGLGDRSQPTYKRSRRGDAAVDRAAVRALADTERPHRVVDFSPYGYDERQFCSPGFNLPFGRFGRGQHGEYPEYHTSADNLDFVTPESLADSFGILLQIIDVCERDRVWRNTSPYGEPQLGRRGLYRSIGATMNRQSVEMGLLWVLNLADGTNSLLDIAERAGLPFDAVADAAEALAGVGLLVEENP